MIDPKSYETARYFLADFEPVDESMNVQLAQQIQDVIDDWIGDAEAQGQLREAPDPDRLREDRDDRRECLRGLEDL